MDLDNGFLKYPSPIAAKSGNGKADIALPKIQNTLENNSKGISNNNRLFAGNFPNSIWIYFTGFEGKEPAQSVTLAVVF
jgi:hypothetical protein